MKVVGQLDNPFVATSLELVALDTQNVMEESVVASLSEIREVGQTLHAAYVRERLEIHLFQYLISSSETTC